MLTFKQGIRKSALLTEIKKHEDADQFIQGTYGEGSGDNFRGCAVGCSIDSINRIKGITLDPSDHAAYEKQLGIPEWLARLEDRIFEGLPVALARKWPMRFTRAIPVGVDLEPLKWHFTAFLLQENIDQVLSLELQDSLKTQVVDSIRGVLTVTEAAISTGVWDESAAESAESAAESAAWSAAWSAAESAAWSAAWSAASRRGRRSRRRGRRRSRRGRRRVGGVGGAVGGVVGGVGGGVGGVGGVVGGVGGGVGL